MNDSERLRNDRLVFYEAEMTRIREVLNDLLRLSNASCALLVDKEGHLVAQHGNAEALSADTISALVAGSFAATREMARLLGEDEFSVMFHQGQRDNIQLNLVGDRTILTVIFDDRTTVGMVRLYANEASARLADVFADAANAEPSEEESMPIGDDYESGARDRLDSLFGSAMAPNPKNQ